jgi:hypothetical protein
MTNQKVQALIDAILAILAHKSKPDMWTHYNEGFNYGLDIALKEVSLAFSDEPEKQFVTKKSALADLLDAIEGVLTYDWSDSDEDAVEAIERLRKANDDYGVVQRFAAGATAVDCFAVVNALIKPGDLGGNGLDKNAERNGLILAANAIAALLHPPPVEPGWHHCETCQCPEIEAAGLRVAEPPASTTEPKVGDSVTVTLPLVADLGQGWIIDRIEKAATYYIRHPNGNHVAVPLSAFTVNRGEGT